MRSKDLKVGMLVWVCKHRRKDLWYDTGYKAVVRGVRPRFVDVEKVGGKITTVGSHRIRAPWSAYKDEHTVISEQRKKREEERQRAQQEYQRTAELRVKKQRAIIELLRRCEIPVTFQPGNPHSVGLQVDNCFEPLAKAFGEDPIALLAYVALVDDAKTTT